MTSLLSQKHKKIGTFGLSKTSTSSYKVLHKVAKVICHDQNTAHQEEFARHYGKKNIVDILDPRWEKLDKIVLSHGVPLTHDIVKIANVNNILITSDIELLFEENPLANYIVITGTNGKSTTVSLIGHILLTFKFDYQVGGNIGMPALSMNLNSFGYVLELSSFQLDLLNSFKAKIAILLNISKDHLDRYGSIKNYIASQKKIFDRQNKESFAIISVDNPITNNLFEQLIIENQTNLIPISTNKILNGGVSVSHNIIYDNIAESPTCDLPPYNFGWRNQ